MKQRVTLPFGYDVLLFTNRRVASPLGYIHAASQQPVPDAVPPITTSRLIRYAAAGLTRRQGVRSNLPGARARSGPVSSSSSVSNEAQSLSRSSSNQARAFLLPLDSVGQTLEDVVVSHWPSPISEKILADAPFDP